MDTAVFARYLAFQLPGMLGAGLVLSALAHFDTLSPVAAVILFGLWVAKDLAFYPFVKVAYERRSPMNPGVKDLVGQTGISRDALAPEGYVMIGAELWRARTRDAAEPIPAGSSVRVEAVVGLMVIVTAGDDLTAKSGRPT